MADATQPNIDEFLGANERPRWQRTIRKPWVKWPLIAVGVVLLILLAMRLFGAEPQTGYATEDVTNGNLTVTVSATGKLAPTEQVQVGSELSGLVTQVLVDVNDRVTAGQALALIDPSQLDDQIRQGQAQVNANQAQVAQAQATLGEARAQLARFEEVSRLSGGRVPAETELEAARAAVARAQAALRVSQANVVAAQASLNSNQTQRSRAVIRSPVNGVVLARQIDAGQTVAASFNTPTLFVIAQDLSQMQLEVAIDEADVGQVADGQRATFTVDAFPGQTFPAQITRVDVGSNLSAQAASSSSTGTATTGTAGQVVSYAAQLSVANADQQLRPGMTATAEIVTIEKRGVLLIPNAALRFTPQSASEQAATGGGGMAGALIPRGKRGGRNRPERTATVGRGAQQTVYILGAEGQPEPVQITTGETNGLVTEVTGGNLRPGAKIITGQFTGDGGNTKAGSGGRQGGGGGKRGG
ncbi:efflux RND transporter periplasmic adaptor subunit [Sphingomonas aestuarii]|jgi:HlyD family secretion protein